MCYAGSIGCDLLAFGVAEAEGAAAEAVGAAVVALEVVAEDAFVLVVAFELALAGAGLLLFVDTLFVGAEAAEEVVAEGDADVVDGGDAGVVGEGDADLVPEGVAVGAAEGDETEEDEGPAAATEQKAPPRHAHNRPTCLTTCARQTKDPPVSTCCRYLGWKRKFNGVMMSLSSLFKVRVLTAPPTHSRTTIVKQSFCILSGVGDEGDKWPMK